MDNVSLSFVSLQMSYTLQQPNGSPGQTIVEGFNFKTNRQI
jgi:hypothetical protein